MTVRTNVADVEQAIEVARDAVQLLDVIEPISDRLSAAFLEHAKLLPLKFEFGKLQVASWIPEPLLDVQALDELRLLVGAAQIVVVSAPESAIRQAIRRVYARSTVTASGVIAKLTTGSKVNNGNGKGASLDDLVQLAHEAPVIRLVNLLLLEALEARASDVHLEHEESRLCVRYRVDGILHEAPSPPANLSAAVTSRIKIMAQLDIAERRLPQDGRIQLKLQDRSVDVRVSIVPSLDGESVVLRLLDKDREKISLDDLGMPDGIREAYERVIRFPQGMVLTTGPTGSGKTTTLYASVDCIKSGREKILAVEDPVEYRLTGVTQIPVNDKVGLSFAVALRALLRQDPDVLLVGEIRDPATAEIAVQAALTGHLVLSTLHTNDAAGALTRLLDLGVPPYLVASTVEAVLAQRLVRLVCVDCGERHPIQSTERKALGLNDSSCDVVRGRGCSSCRGAGYRGRIGIYELLIMSDDVRTVVARHQPVWQVREAAARGGMRFLLHSGADLVARGLTTPEEILRVARESSQSSTEPTIAT